MTFAGTWQRLVLGVAAALLLLLPGPVLAAGDNDPPVFRNPGAQYVIKEPRVAAPLVRFFDGAGGALDLGRFRGKVVVLNFWATWCLACLREMPSLDRLQTDLGGAKFTVAALSTDRKGLQAVRPYFRRLGIKHLETYLDPGQRLGDTLGLFGFPVTFIIDHKGRVAGSIIGETDWDSAGARALLKYYIDRVGG